MSKINVKVCLGTTCFVMGAAKLQELPELMPSEWKDLVEITPQACLDMCKNFKYVKSPFVYVDDELISEADVKKVFDCIEKKLKLKNNGVGA